MRGVRAVSVGVMAAAVAAVGTVALGSVVPAYADDTVTVQGTAFPTPRVPSSPWWAARISTSAPPRGLQPMVGLGPGAAPAGSRSLGFDLAGGNAVGALYAVGLDALDQHRQPGRERRRPEHRSRLRRLPGAGRRRHLPALDRPLRAGDAGRGLADRRGDHPGLHVAKYDMTTRQRAADGLGVPTTVADFAQAHGGDGPGVYTIGFGCDGTPFSMDAMRVGSRGAVTTYDVEGLRTMVTIAARPAARRTR